jgi:hypothetical protein
MCLLVEIIEYLLFWVVVIYYNILKFIYENMRFMIYLSNLDENSRRGEIDDDG